MPSPFDGLADVMLSAFGEGEVATLTPPGGGPARTVRVIWDSDYFETTVDAQQGVELVTRGSAAHVSAAEAGPAAKRGARLLVGGRSLEVRDARPDGIGMVSLVLGRSGG